MVLSGTLTPATLQKVKPFDPATMDITRAIKSKKYYWIDPRKLTTPQLLECLRLLHPEHYDTAKNTFSHQLNTNK